MSSLITSQSTSPSSSPANTPPAEPTARPSMRRAVSTAGVLALLAAVGIWGVRSGWQFPVWGATDSDPTAGAAWCDEHNVGEAECIECNAKLVPALKDHGWCKEHGIHQCPLHHPDIAQLKKPLKITEEDFARASRALELMPRVKNNPSCNLHTRRIQFASPEAIAKAGVDIAVVARQPVVEAIVANGEVDYDQTHVAHLAPRVPGSVWKVLKNVGDRVQSGDVLALIDAAEVGQSKAEFLKALAAVRIEEQLVERLRPLAGDGVVSGRKLQEQQARLEEARIRVTGAEQSLLNLGLPIKADEFAGVPTNEVVEKIRLLGIPDELAASLDPSAFTANLLPIRASIDGEVVGSEVVRGEVVDAQRILYTLADTSRMWLTLAIRQDDARFVVPGRKVRFRANEWPAGEELTGEVTWVSTSADKRSRTVQARVELPNKDGRLRANTFGAARIVLREEPQAIVVPSEAVHWDGNCNVVFVRDKRYFEKDAPKFFHVRPVRVGVQEGGTTEIIVGLLPGEVIASKNSVVLQAQLLRGNLGPGCGHCH